MNITKVFTIVFSETKSLVNRNSKLAGPKKSASTWINWHRRITPTVSLKRNSKDTKDSGISPSISRARTHRCDFDLICELQSHSKTVSIVNQVKKLQNQYLHSNTGDGTLPQAIPCGTRPTAGGPHDFFEGHFILFVTVGFVHSRWRSIVTDGSVHRNTSHVIFLLHSAHTE